LGKDNGGKREFFYYVVVFGLIPISNWGIMILLSISLDNLFVKLLYVYALDLITNVIIYGLKKISGRRTGMSKKSRDVKVVLFFLKPLISASGILIFLARLITPESSMIDVDGAMYISYNFLFNWIFTSIILFVVVYLSVVVSVRFS